MKGDIAPIGVAILISRHGGHVTHTAWDITAIGPGTVALNDITKTSNDRAPNIEKSSSI